MGYVLQRIKHRLRISIETHLTFKPMYLPLFPHFTYLLLFMVNILNKETINNYSACLWFVIKGAFVFCMFCWQPLSFAPFPMMDKLAISFARGNYRFFVLLTNFLFCSPSPITGAPIEGGLSCQPPSIWGGSPYPVPPERLGGDLKRVW